MIGPITSAHHDRILRLNADFVTWLSPLDVDGLAQLLSDADYARQINEADGVLFGYAQDADVTDHENLNWLRKRLENFFYIDRIIIAAAAQGQSLGRQLYSDVEAFARMRGHHWLACEVNTRPDNPGSHAFHLRAGFSPIGDRLFPASGKAVRYYAKAL